MQKKLLFINQNPPYGTGKAQASFDLLMMASAFDFAVNLLFLNDGVFQLIATHDSENIHRKNLSKQFKGLELFDIANIYVVESALLKRNLSSINLSVDVHLINEDEVNNIMKQHDFLLTL